MDRNARELGAQVVLASWHQNGSQVAIIIHNYAHQWHEVVVAALCHQRCLLQQELLVLRTRSQNLNNTASHKLRSQSQNYHQIFFMVHTQWVACILRGIEM